jgi:hypothetical protein
MQWAFFVFGGQKVRRSNVRRSENEKGNEGKREKVKK